MRDAKTLVISFILINPCSAMSQLPLCATGVQCTFLARSSGARHAPNFYWLLKWKTMSKSSCVLLGAGC